MIPPRFVPFVFGLILSGVMSLLVSGIATWRAVGMPPDFISLWMPSWLNSWAVAFPTLLIMGPIVRKLVARFTKPSDSTPSA